MNIGVCVPLNQSRNPARSQLQNKQAASQGPIRFMTTGSAERAETALQARAENTGSALRESTRSMAEKT